MRLTCSSPEATLAAVRAYSEGTAPRRVLRTIPVQEAVLLPAKPDDDDLIPLPARHVEKRTARLTINP